MGRDHVFALLWLELTNYKQETMCSYVRLLNLVHYCPQLNINVPMLDLSINFVGNERDCQSQNSKIPWKGEKDFIMLFWYIGEFYFFLLYQGCCCWNCDCWRGWRSCFWSVRFRIFACWISFSSSLIIFSVEMNSTYSGFSHWRVSLSLCLGCDWPFVKSSKLNLYLNDTL